MSERWQQVKEILQSVLEKPSDKREQFLDKVCGNDDSLRREIEELIASSANAGSFMEVAAIGEVAGILVGAEKDLQIGERFNQYNILSHLGAGGMGEVYLAEDTKLNRRVALKLLPPNLSADENANRRLLREARSAAALDHPHICQIHEIGEADKRSFIVMQFCEGETLEQKLKKASLSLRETLDLAIQIADALSNAHSHYIIHRDIKPANIIVSQHGHAKILDFGLAKIIAEKTNIESEAETAQILSAENLIIGTPPYMSPEQVRGQPLDARSDIFSFGATVYEMLSGRQPFQRESHAETISAILNFEPPFAKTLADEPPELQRIVQKSLAKDKEKRYQTAKDLLIDLQNVSQYLSFKDKLERSTELQSETKTQIFDALEITDESPKQKGTETTAAETNNSKLVFIGGSLILLFAVAGFGYWFFAERNAKQIEAIAVMPFVNESGNADVEYLSDGMTETLISSLSQLPKVSVKARSSVFRFKGKDTNPQTIGKELNVQAILNGRVIQRGDDLTLYLSLDDVQTGDQIWGKQYNRKITNLVLLQSEIARDVSTNLQTKLSGADERKLTKNYTTNPDAYQLYLKGRFHALKLTPPELQTGISYFQQAIEIDPSYALAYVGLADAYRGISIVGEVPSTEYLPKSKANAQKAIELDDTLAEAHASLGFALFRYDWNWNEAEKQCWRALELDPNSADAHQVYAHLLSNTGHHTESLAEIIRARELDPLNLRINALEGEFLIHAGQTDAALDRLQKTLELDQGYYIAHMFASSAYIEKGMFAEAVAEARRARELSGVSSYPTAFLGYALAKSGKQAEARTVLEELLKTSAGQYVSPYNIAMIYNGLNDRDKTLDWLEKGLEKRDVRMTYLKVEPKWNNLRNKPRFQDLLRRIGFESIAADTQENNSKLYWQMPDARQIAFIRERAQHIQTLIGDEPTEFDEEALRAIKVEMDDYVERKDSLSQKPFDEGLRVIYGRASQYAPVIVRAYEARQIPPASGLYQAMIESEYHDCHVTKIGSVGLFQFAPKTAAKYNLTPKDYCDVEKQSDAAARYMSDLTSDFVNGKSSATLGLLGFVIGEGRVREYLRQLRGRGVSERSFWTIFRHRADLQPPLSDEGKEYVPRFFAVAVIGETPESFELSTPPLTTLREQGK